jgi:hypothetical protein
VTSLSPEPSRCAPKADSDDSPLFDALYFRWGRRRTGPAVPGKAFAVMTEGRKAFLVFGVLPTILWLILYNVSFRVDYVENPIPSIPEITATWNTWHAYEHEWCYIVAVIIWFAAIWLYLGPRKKEASEPRSVSR